METELKSLVDRYGDAELRSTLKKMNLADSSKSAKLIAGFSKVLEEVGPITLKRFKKEAATAWKRTYPDGIEKRPLRGYQLFVKEKMPQVIADNPDLTHSERMTVVGRMWQEYKTPHISTQEAANLPLPEDDVMPEAEVPPSRTRASKRGRK